LQSVFLEVGLEPPIAGAGAGAGGEQADAADAAAGPAGSGRSSGRRVEEEEEEEEEAQALVRRMVELRDELDRQRERRTLLQQRTGAAEAQLKVCEEAAAGQLRGA